jgi:nitrous oxide reductase accessory protein NosL
MRAYAVHAVFTALLLAGCSKSGAKEEEAPKPYVASPAMQEKVERIVRKSAEDPKARVMVTKETEGDACGFVATKGDVVRFVADFGEDQAYLARGSSDEDSIVAAKC